MILLELFQNPRGPAGLEAVSFSSIDGRRKLLMPVHPKVNFSIPLCWPINELS